MAPTSVTMRPSSISKPGSHVTCEIHGLLALCRTVAKKPSTDPLIASSGHLETVASFLEFFRPRTCLMQGLRGLRAFGRLLVPLHVQRDPLVNLLSGAH